MVDLLVSTTLITAFIAGVAALFAPCCITVLLPAYLGSIFRQRRTVFLMTFIFFLGLLAVFLPLGLGVAGIGQFFSTYHNIIYIAGGLFLLLLGSSILLGKHFSMPFSVSPNVKVQSAGSVFVLGIFSAFATLCCAPVLAGVLALSVLPGSMIWGGIYSLTYVLGMVVPLFVIAYFLDKKDFTKMFYKMKVTFSYSFLGKKVSITVANLISGAMFVLMGLLILYLAGTNQLAMRGSEYQTTINITAANISSFIAQYVGWMPSFAWALIVLATVAFIYKTATEARR